MSQKYTILLISSKQKLSARLAAGNFSLNDASIGTSFSNFAKNSTISFTTMSQRDSWEKSNLDILFENIRSFRSSIYYRELLNMCGKFRHLSPYNAMLVKLQKPGSQWVMRKEEWRRLYHRRLKPNAQPLIILVPFGPVDYLFEIGDTESDLELLPESDDELLEFLARPYKTKRDVDPDELERLQERCAFHGIAFDMEMNAGVDYAAKIELLEKPRVNKNVCIKKDHSMDLDAPYLISINKSASSGEKMAALAHELGHLFCRHLPAPSGWKPWDVRSLPMNEREFEAESVAWLICERLNIGNPSEAYLSGYLDDNEMIPAGVSIENIFHAFNFIWELCRNDKNLYFKEGLLYQKNPDLKKLTDGVIQKGRQSRRPT